MRLIANLLEEQTRKRALGIALVLLVACRHGGECIAVPGCPPAEAALITITSSATNTAVNGVTITVNGDVAHALQCDGNCLVPGYAGKYVFDISAPGFATVQRTIVVTGATKQFDVYGPEGFEGKSCDCAVVDRQRLDVVLTPAS